MGERDRFACAVGQLGDLFRPVLLIDEAQEMSPLLLAELRLLGSTKLDTCTIVTVVLCGDRRLEDKLRTPDLLPVASRIRTRLVLDDEPPDVLGTMLRHLLAVAGNATLMTDELQHTVCEHAAGNRRVLMNLCNDLLVRPAPRRDIRLGRPRARGASVSPVILVGPPISMRFLPLALIPTNGNGGARRHLAKATQLSWVETFAIVGELNLVASGASWDRNDGLTNPPLGHTGENCAFATTYGAGSSFSHLGTGKPWNLLIEPKNRRGKLIDFGVPAIAGGIGGTPAYMAPELARAMLKQVAFDQLDRCKLDIFGLGALAYHLVYGETLFASSGDVEKDLAAAADARPTVSKYKRTLWGKGAGRAANILCRALAHNPADRYASVADLAKDIESWLEDFPLIEEQHFLLRRFRLWCYRVRTPLAVVSLAFAGVIALSIVAVLLSKKVTQTSAQLDTLKNQVRASKDDLESAKQQVQTKQEELEKLTNKVGGLSSEVKERLIQVKGLSSQVEGLERKVKELSNDLAYNIGSNRQLTSTADQLARALVTTHGDLASSQQAFAETKAQLDRMTTDLTSTNNALRERTSALNEKTSTLVNVVAELGKCQALLEETMRLLTSTKNELTDIKGKLRAETVAKDAATKETVALKADAGRLVTENAALRAELERAKAAGDVKASDSKSAEPKSVETKPAAPKSEETKPTAPKSEETKPAAPKSDEISL